MKGRIFGTLFALPFFCVGVWMLWSIGGTFYNAWQMSDWTPADARLTTAGYETHRGDDSNTYEAYARFELMKPVRPSAKLSLRTLRMPKYRKNTPV